MDVVTITIPLTLGLNYPFVYQSKELKQKLNPDTLERTASVSMYWLSSSFQLGIQYPKQKEGYSFYFLSCSDEQNTDTR